LYIDGYYLIRGIANEFVINEKKWINCKWKKSWLLVTNAWTNSLLFLDARLLKGHLFQYSSLPERYYLNQLLKPWKSSDFWKILLRRKSRIGTISVYRLVSGSEKWSLMILWPSWVRDEQDIIFEIEEFKFVVSYSRNDSRFMIFSAFLVYRDY
jgi:hypothetical protein